MRQFNPIPEDIGDWLRHDNGHLIWLRRNSNRIRIGDVAGHVGESGYVLVGFKGKLYRSHRIIFFLVHGRQPGQIDHIGGDGLNNSPINLREATQSQNAMNGKMRTTNTSGAIGVCWSKALNKWAASIKVNRKAIHLGYFEDFEDAVAARKKGEIKYFGEYSKAASLAASKGVNDE